MNAIHKRKENGRFNLIRTKVCLASCRRLLAQIAKTRDAVLAEFRGTLEAQEHLLHLALNEAEVLAWQTGYPQLVFPTLATEKARDLAAWHVRQQSMNGTGSSLTFAAWRNNGDSFLAN